MKLKKNIKIGKVNIYILAFFLSIFFIFFLHANENTVSSNDIKFVELNILDKVSSKAINVKLNIGKQYEFKNLSLKVLKCKNSEFDDNPEVTAYLQVRDLNSKSNDEVFIFNGWTFASSPSLKPFDHPVYDIWLIKCY